MRIITNYTLKKASEHVSYEVSMLYNTAIILKSTTDQLTKNILLESFAIHARNLFDFFYPKKHFNNSDILVTDYIENKKIYNKQKTKKKTLKYLVRKADKQIAHLTYTRNKYNLKTKSWYFKDISDKFKPTVIAFFENLPENRKKWPNFERLKKELIDRFLNI